MILHIPDVLPEAQIRQARQMLDAAEWTDGKSTAGAQAAKTKNNLQLSLDNPVAQQLGSQITQALSQNPLFMSAALPLRVLPPMFNRYEGGGHFGVHVDNAIRHLPGGGRMRTDLSATLFFADPDEYDGGELTIEDTYGTQSVKLPAGHLILYPSTSLHHVTPVTRGARVSSFFWIQSMVRDDQRRSLLFDLDSSIQRLGLEAPDHEGVSQTAVQLTGLYHNLIRQWTEV